MPNTIQKKSKLADTLRGTRVLLTSAWGAFDQGDAGTIVEYDTGTCLCRVKFDAGAEQDFPASMLVREGLKLRFVSVCPEKGTAAL